MSISSSAILSVTLSNTPQDGIDGYTEVEMPIARMDYFTILSRNTDDTVASPSPRLRGEGPGCTSLLVV